MPVCAGVTFFKIQVPKGEDFLDRWASDSLPRGIVLTISFAEPYEALDGTFDVLDAEKTTRTIAIGRTRKIKFTIEKKEDEEQK